MRKEVPLLNNYCRYVCNLQPKNAEFRCFFPVSLEGFPTKLKAAPICLVAHSLLYIALQSPRKTRPLCFLFWHFRSSHK